MRALINIVAGILGEGADQSRRAKNPTAVRAEIDGYVAHLV